MLTLPYFFSVSSTRLDHVDEEFAVEVGATGAVPSEQIVTRLGRRFGGRARGDVGDGDVVDGDLRLVLRPQSFANSSNHLSYAGTKWLHCTMDNVLVCANERETNGAEIRGVPLAAATASPVFLRN